MAEIDRAHAEALDAADPLASFRDRFVINDSVVCINRDSLGRLPREVAERVSATVEDWGARLVSGWSDWIDHRPRSATASHDLHSLGVADWRRLKVAEPNTWLSRCSGNPRS